MDTGDGYEVKDIKLHDQYKILVLGDDSEVYSKAVIITTGVDYRKLDTEGIDKFTGAGVYYGAATTEAHACMNKAVYIVGGGNSAGQAAMYMSKFANNVYIAIRKEDLSSSMSQYLIDQIDQMENIHLLPKTVVKSVDGNERLERMVLESLEDNSTREVEAAALMIFIGARPYTDWLNPGIVKDPRGFIETGNSITHHEDFRKIWKLDRDPSLLETSIPGIFAAGDVRSGAMNRVASAVGEGAMAIKFVHEYLAEN